MPWEIFTAGARSSNRKVLSAVQQGVRDTGTGLGRQDLLPLHLHTETQMREQYLRDQGTRWSLFVNITNKTCVCIGEICPCIFCICIVCTPEPLASVHVQCPGVAGQCRCHGTSGVQAPGNSVTPHQETRDMAKRINVGLDEFNKVNGGWVLSVDNIEWTSDLKTNKH